MTNTALLIMSTNKSLPIFELSEFGEVRIDYVNLFLGERNIRKVFFFRS